MGRWRRRNPPPANTPNDVWFAMTEEEKQAKLSESRAWMQASRRHHERRKRWAQRAEHFFAILRVLIRLAVSLLIIWQLWPTAGWPRVAAGAFWLVAMVGYDVTIKLDALVERGKP